MKSLAPDPILLRMFDPEKDYETLSLWWRDRGRNPPLKVFLPKLGVIAYCGERELAMAFLYMDNSTGVCFLELPISRPGLGLKEAREAFGRIVDFLKLEAAKLGYQMMYAYTFPALAREARKYGFRALREGMIMIGVPLIEELEYGNGH